MNIQIQKNSTKIKKICIVILTKYVHNFVTNKIKKIKYNRVDYWNSLNYFIYNYYLDEINWKQDKDKYISI